MLFEVWKCSRSAKADVLTRLTIKLETNGTDVYTHIAKD